MHARKDEKNYETNFFFLDHLRTMINCLVKKWSTILIVAFFVYNLGDIYIFSHFKTFYWGFLFVLFCFGWHTESLTQTTKTVGLKPLSEGSRIPSLDFLLQPKKQNVFDFESFCDYLIKMGIKLSEIIWKWQYWACYIVGSRWKSLLLTKNDLLYTLRNPFIDCLLT